MCRPATCRSCSKTTWAGCGLHVDQVLRNVPADQRCSCDQDSGSRPSGGRTSGGLFRRRAAARGRG